MARERLRHLEGDVGARELLKTTSINWIDWHDDSIHRDMELSTMSSIEAGLTCAF